MKKIISLMVIAGFAAMVACGPSAEEKAATEKARQDSIESVNAKMAADSMAAMQEQMEKMKADSMSNAEKMKADSMEAAGKAKKPVSKPKPKTTEEKRAVEVKKVAGGRGH